MKVFSILTLLMVPLTAFAQQRGTIHVKKKNIVAVKPCICGQSDTVYLTRKQAFMDGNTIDICQTGKILKTKVVSFGSVVTTTGINPVIQWIQRASDNSLVGNKLWAGTNPPPVAAFSRINISDVKYVGESGIKTLSFPLVIILTD